MDLGLTGRHVLITGASRGIGAATALCFAREGCRLDLVARSESGLRALASRIQAETGIESRCWPADLSRIENVDRIFDACRHVDVLVNNAGAIPFGTIDSLDDAAWRDGWNLKVFGYIHSCRRALAAMRERRRGVILNVIGIAGERPRADYIAGSSANASLMALTRALGAASMRDGVRVLGINPGLIETARTQALEASTPVDSEIPRGRPEHIADLAAFLASDRSANTTGAIVTVDGGWSAR